MTAPHPFQLEDVEWIEKRGGRGLLAWSMGTGKTFGSLLFLSRNRSRFPAVVVCPASVKYGWQREAAEHFGWRAAVLEGTSPRPWPAGRRPNLAVVNYDILGPWLNHLKGACTVILDECQNCCNPETRRAAACRELCEGVPHVLALSGTPLINRPRELWPALNIVDPESWPAFQPFGMRYCGPKMKYGRWTFNGASREDELHRVLTRNCMRRRRLEDVIDQMPAFTRDVLPVRVEDLREYREARDDFVTWAEKAGYNATARAEGLSKLTAMKRLLGEAKIPLLTNWIGDFLKADEGKLVVFAVHRRVVKAVEEKFGDQAVRIDGSVTGRLRQSAVDAFRSRRQIRVCVGNIKAMGVGLNGLQVANRELFAELGWNPGTHAQAEARCHRIGQKRPVTATYMVVKDTLEEGLLELIQRKQEVLSRVLDGKARRRGDFDLYEKLREMIAKEDR